MNSHTSSSAENKIFVRRPFKKYIFPIALLTLAVGFLVVAVYLFTNPDISQPNSLNMDGTSESYLQEVQSYPLLSEESEDLRIYTSQEGRFSIELPANIVVTEKMAQETNGYLSYEVILTIGDYQEPVEGQPTPAQFVISFAKPEIYGKGGACTIGYTKAIVANQEVNVCDSAEYFHTGYIKHPQKEIEYSLHTSGKFNAEEVDIFRKVVMKTFKLI